MLDLAKLIKEFTNKDKKFRIKLLGDSITHGHSGTGYAQDGFNFIRDVRRNPNGYCWANLFKANLESNYNCQVVNNGISGIPIESVIRDFDLLVDDEDDFIICTIGTNNRHQYKNKGAKKSVEEMSNTFYNNILLLNQKLSERNVKYVLIANIPACKEREEDTEEYWRILHMNDINDIYKRAQRDLGFEFISLYDLFSAYIKKNDIPLESLLADGLHPNDKGYKVMYELLRKEFNV